MPHPAGANRFVPAVVSSRNQQTGTYAQRKLGLTDSGSRALAIDFEDLMPVRPPWLCPADQLVEDLHAASIDCDRVVRLAAGDGSQTAIMLVSNDHAENDSSTRPGLPERLMTRPSGSGTRSSRNIKIDFGAEDPYERLHRPFWRERLSRLTSSS